MGSGEIIYLDNLSLKELGIPRTQNRLVSPNNINPAKNQYPLYFIISLKAIHWPIIEVINEFEIGIDSKLWDNRIGLNASVFKRKTSDLITLITNI